MQDVTFSLNKGEFAVLCGKSGCGKSTLLRHLKKNLMPYGRLQGSICYLGQEIEELPKRLCASEITGRGMKPVLFWKTRPGSLRSISRVSAVSFRFP